MHKTRLAVARLLRLMEQFPAVVIAGARQVGKSTLAKLALPEADFVIFDPVTDIENARADPDLFLGNHGTPVVLDEIQYAPELVPALKRWIDRDRAPGQYLLTGSQHWEVFRSLSESLSGRVAFIDLEGFCLAEIAERISGTTWLEDYLAEPLGFLRERRDRLPSSRTMYERLWRGSFPEADTLDEDVISDFHAAYLRTYIERDARLLVDVTDWQQFGKFYRLVSAATAQEVNHSQLGREVGVSPQTARRWLDILVATFQWHEVPAYFGNAIKRVAKKPRGYLADSGSICAAMRISSPRALADHPSLGAIFETAVVAEIRKLLTVVSPKPVLHHWRLHSGSEVDLILERDGWFHPIEIKVKSRPTRGDARGLVAFRKNHPHLRVAPGLVIAPTDGVHPLTEHDYAIPWNLGPG